MIGTSKVMVSTMFPVALFAGKQFTINEIDLDTFNTLKASADYYCISITVANACSHLIGATPIHLDTDKFTDTDIILFISFIMAEPRFFRIDISNIHT